MEAAARYLPSKLGIWTPLLFFVKLSGLAGAGLLYRADTRHKVTARGYPKNYVVFARKVAR